jgi:hypothetical protein
MGGGGRLAPVMVTIISRHAGIVNIQLQPRGAESAHTVAHVGFA